MKTKTRPDAYNAQNPIHSTEPLHDEAASRQHPLTLESKSPEPIQPSPRLSQQRKLLSGEELTPPGPTEVFPTRSQRLSGWLRLQLQELKQTTASVFTTHSPPEISIESDPWQGLTPEPLENQGSIGANNQTGSLEEENASLPPLLMPIREGSKIP